MSRDALVKMGVLLARSKEKDLLNKNEYDKLNKKFRKELFEQCYDEDIVFDGFSKEKAVDIFIDILDCYMEHE